MDILFFFFVFKLRKLILNIHRSWSLILWIRLIRFVSRMAPLGPAYKRGQGLSLEKDVKYRFREVNVWIGLNELK